VLSLIGEKEINTVRLGVIEFIRVGPMTHIAPKIKQCFEPIVSINELVPIPKESDNKSGQYKLNTNILADECHCLL
jgi:hypothetical protein